MTSAPIELVVTDLDGTLWGPSARCSAETLAALDRLDADGVGVLVATGRRRRSAAAGLEPNGLRRPAVLLNGGHGWDYRHDHMFHLAGFDPAEAHAVVDLTARIGLSPVLYVDGDDPDCYATPKCSTRPRHLETLRPYVRETGDLHAVIDAHLVIGFAILGTELASLAEAADELTRHRTGVATTSVDHQYGGGSLMVQPTGVTKWAGVEAFCAAERIDPTRVAAVGDAGNDLAMLEAAAVAIVVATAPSDVLAVADHVIAPPDQGGWADIPDLI